MPTELFANNASTTVSSGGTTAPSAGTSESWTVASSSAFPAASNSASPKTQFRIVDPALPTEVMLVTNVSGTTWTVTRGAEGTPVAHTAGFTVQQAVSNSWLAKIESNFTSGWLNAKYTFDAKGDGSTDDTAAIQAALTAAAPTSTTSSTSPSSTVFLPPGVYVTGPLTIPHRVKLQGSGIGVTRLLMKSSAANNAVMLSNLSTATMTSISDLSVLGNLGNQSNQVHGIVITGSGSGSEYHDERSQITNVLVQDFTGDGVAILGTGVNQIHNVQAWNNKGHGFVLGIDSELSDCDAGQNGRDGFHITGNTKIANSKAWFSGYWNNGSSTSVQTGNILTGSNLLDANTAGIETSAAGWTAGSNTTIAQSATQHQAGSNSLACTVTATGTSSAITATKYALVGGNQYTASAYVFPPAASKTATVGINWYDASNTFISTTTGSSTALTASAFTQCVVTGDAPRNASQATVTVTFTSGTTSQIFYIDTINLNCNGLYGNGFNFYGASSLSVATGIYAQDNARVGISLQPDGSNSSTSRVIISGWGSDTNNNNVSGTSYPNVELNAAYGNTLNGGFSLARGANTQAPASCVSFAGGGTGNVVQMATSGFTATTKVSGGYQVYGNTITIDGSGGQSTGMSYSSTVTPDITSHNITNTTLTGNMTINAPSVSFTSTSPLTFMFSQDSTGGRTITWNSTYKTNWQPSQGPNSVSSISFVYDSNNAWWTPIGTSPEFLTQINAVSDYACDNTGTNDCTTALQAALNYLNGLGGGALYLPGGTYKISSSLQMYTGTKIYGDGFDRTVISQITTATAQHGLYANSTTAQPTISLEIRDLMVKGPAAGTGVGIFITGDGTQIDGFFVSLSNVYVKDFGSHCIQIDDPVACDLTNVTAKNSINGNGIYIDSGGTSTNLVSCYGFLNANGWGIRLSGMSYCNLDACASDNNGFGYKIDSCNSVTMNGCGAEANGGDSLQISASAGVTVDSFYTNNPGGTAIHVTSNSSGVTITNPTQGGTAGAGASYITIDSGSECTLAGIPAQTKNCTYSGTVIFAESPRDTVDSWSPPSSLTETIPLYLTATNALATHASPGTGIVFMTPIWIPRGMVVNNINFRTGGTAASGPTHWWLGIADSTGKQLAHTADQTTGAIAANTTITKALTAKWICPSHGWYYVLWSQTNSTTSATVLGGTAPAYVTNTLGSAAMAGATATAAQTTPGTDGTTTYTPPAIGAKVAPMYAYLT